jgi:two-component system, response regulator PdtaR
MSRKRIFIVEDEGIVAADLADRLDQLGYDAAGQAASGEMAIKKIAATLPDLILMDIVLQGNMDGVEVAEEIQKLYKIPVVYLTSHADEATMQRARITGPFGYVLKPFEERELHMAIEIALYRRETEARLESLNRKLQTALDEVKTLSGLLPICAWCKKIRDDAGYWQQIENYIKAHSDAQFTHSICPDCYNQVAEKQVNSRRNKSKIEPL